MNTEIITSFDKKFLKLEIFPINQKERHFFIGKIPAKFFLDLYTVEPAEYDINKQTAYASAFKDDSEYYNYLKDEDTKKIDAKAFQRNEDPRRVREISEFLIKEEYALFPNAIIVTCDLINDFLTINANMKFEDLFSVNEFVDKNSSFSFLETKDNKNTLYIPYVKKSVLIIDGQHRIRGLEEAGKNIISNYELLISFIIGYDRATLAKLFYTINYTQKSVNKSLLYHLTGEFSRELDEITFMHEAIKLLNELDSSPFYRRVKMLGSIPEEIPSEERRLMTVSQAFLVDYLSNTISKASARSIHQPIFLYYYKNDKLQIEIIRFLIKYFSAIREIKKEDWNNPAESIISKTIGVGAFIKVLHFIFTKMFIDDFNCNPSTIKDITKEDLISKLKGFERIDFSKSGEFGGVGSSGSLNKLKVKIIEKIRYFKETNYEDFVAQFKRNYLSKFKTWLSKNVRGI